MSDACCCLVCVRTQEVGVVEDLGQFKQLLDPGLHCIFYPLSNVVGRMSLRIQQLDVVCETKTKDNVFVQVGVAVQYRVLVDGAYDAYYRLTDPRNQIQSYGKENERFHFFFELLLSSFSSFFHSFFPGLILFYFLNQLIFVSFIKSLMLSVQLYQEWTSMMHSYRKMRSEALS